MNTDHRKGISILGSWLLLIVGTFVAASTHNVFAAFGIAIVVALVATVIIIKTVMSA